MKLHLKAFWIAASALILAFLLVDTRLALAGDAAPMSIVTSPAGPVIEFQSYRSAIGREKSVPLTGWLPRQPALEIVEIDQTNRDAES